MTTDLDNLHNEADGLNESNSNAQENSEKKTDGELDTQPLESQESTKSQEEEVKEAPENEKAEETTIENANADSKEVEATPESTESEEVKTEYSHSKMEKAETTTDENEADKVESSSSDSEEAKESSESKEGEDYKVEDTSSESEDEEEEVAAVVDQIPLKNYSDLPLGVLIGEAKELLRNHPARLLREHFNQIRDAVKDKIEEDYQSKKEAFEEENPEATDFHYDNPIRKEFYAIYVDYKKQLDTFYKELEKTQQENLTERLQIIDDLKGLYLDNTQENTNIFTTFRNIKTRWHNAGPIPRAQAGNVFKTYFHHLDNFYEYLDLNKELRELDYAHNLEVRHKIIKRSEELVAEDNVQKALNELQYLHRLWKEEAVPVAEEHREPTWQIFKDLTNKIHERKSEISEKLKEEQDKNLKKKQEIIAEIQNLTQESTKKSHGEWQSGIRKLNALRESFLAVGRVPREFNQEMWNQFKTATRDFNHQKNEFYKTLKSEQQTNLDKKMELLKLAKEHAESTDWQESVQIIKRIQADWKKIGHVPRKFSDSIWKEFKEACNKFFDNYKERGNKANEAYEQNFVKKEALFEELKAFTPSEDTKSNLDTVNDFNTRWNLLGKVPASKMSINTEFNKAISQLIKSFGLSENEVQDFKMASLVEQIKSGQDDRLLDDEIKKTRKTIDDLEKEINQLENNISFFANAKEDNPLLKDVFRQIDDKRGRLTEAEIRLRKLHRIDFGDENDQNN